jgi:acetyl esterase/lipase
MRLWDGPAPGAEGDRPDDIPTLTQFLVPGSREAAGFVVCPGGGYAHLAPHEGAPVAQWLNSLGINAFVLKYRLGPRYHHPVEMHDVQRALRVVRANAKRWHVDPDRLGIIGFSAGGHLASTAATHFDPGVPDAADPVDRFSCRPNLAILIYPVITMVGPFVHEGSRENLLGKDPDAALLKLMSNDQQVTAATPPCFLVHTTDDHVVPFENSLLFAAACHEKGVPVELHVFEHGQHGFGLGGGDPVLSSWPSLAATWLRVHDFLKE